MSGTGRQTTFLTLDEGHRAPSAYHVDAQSVSVRARQEHRSGPTVTSEKMRVQAFTKTKEQARIVADIISDHSQQSGIDPATALRLAIADGLAVPTAFHGAAHVEASRDEIGKGNPHISGGLVSFAAKGSPLSSFDTVALNTELRKKQAKKHKPMNPTITTTTTHQPPAQTLEFNQNALEMQHAFMQDLMTPKK